MLAKFDQFHTICIKNSYLGDISYCQESDFDQFAICEGMFSVLDLHSPGYGCENPGCIHPSKFFQSIKTLSEPVLTDHQLGLLEIHLGLPLLTLSWDKNWDNHSPMNGYLSFYPRIALVAPSPEGNFIGCDHDNSPGYEFHSY